MTMRPSKNHSSPLPRDIADKAAEWLLEKREGFAPGRAEQFRTWCEADPRHALAVAKTERALALLGELPELKQPISDRFGEEKEEAAPLPHRRRLWWLGAGLTAAAAALILGAVAWWQKAAAPIAEVNFVSNADHPQQVVLDDGSFVDLNTHTTIRTQMLPHERRISLREGEAYFAVAPDPARPFIVEAAGVKVRAVGTAFNVRIGSERVEVLVLEGKVEITGPGAEAAGVATEKPQLGIAERAIIPRDAHAPGLVVEQASREEIHEAQGWHSFVTTISSRPLREIVELLNRRSSVRLVIADPELGDINLGGALPIRHPQTFIRLLELEGDVVAEPRGENEIVLRRRR